MLKILQARLQQYVNHELPDVQAGFRKSRGTRDQIANICWIMEKAREFQKAREIREKPERLQNTRVKGKKCLYITSDQKGCKGPAHDE